MAARTPEAIEEAAALPPRRVFGPSLSSAVVLVVALALLLLATGWHQVRAAAPALAPILASTVLSPARLAFALDDTGKAVAGKVAASLLCALAAGVLFLAVGRRQTESSARWTSVLFALGTGVWSASLALGPQPFALLLLCVGLLGMVRAEEDPAWAGRSGLPLALAAAIQPLDAALVGTLALGLAVRWPRRVPALLLWGLPGLGLLLYQRTYAMPPLGPGPADGSNHLAALASPAHGLLILSPLTVVAVAGLVSTFRHGERALATSLASAALAHWVFVGFLETRPQGWGPGAMIDALPVLLLLLPEGLEAGGGLGGVLAAVSVVVQAMLAFADAGRWERLYAADTATRAAAQWDLASSPVAFALRERTAMLALPGVAGAKAFLREHPLVLLGPEGSRVAFAAGEAAVSGAEALFGDVHLRGGARAEDSRLRLRASGDGLFLRVRATVRARPRLELRIVGRGRGTLIVSERTFWSALPRKSEYAATGEFRLRHPYRYPDSGGPDLTISLASGSADLESVTLASPGDPENPIRLPPGP